MTTIDDRIRDALDADDKAFLQTLEEDRGMFRQMGDDMGGALGGWARLMMVMAVVIGLAVLYTFYRMLTADALEDRITWGVLSLATLIMQGFLKEWMFARMNMLNVLREVKRLQVQVAMLSEERR